jgi:hypothetical protein
MKKTWIIALFLGLLVAAGGGWFIHGHDARRANREAFETDLTEGLVQGIMQEMDADGPKFYFLAFGAEQTNPSRLFIARFARHFPPVRGIASAFMLRNGKMVETAGGRAGVVIQIIRCKKIGPGTADLRVVFPKLPAGGNRFVYRLTDTGGKWTIQSRQPDV